MKASKPARDAMADRNDPREVRLVRYPIPQLWEGGTCIVAASGPSLAVETAELCRRSGHPAIAVKQAVERMAWAQFLYGCDTYWWNHHRGFPDYGGERWSDHHRHDDPKLDVAERYGVNLVYGKNGEGFSTDPGCIHLGGNSGFQATDLALHFGATTIILVGFDMHDKRGRNFIPKPMARPRQPFGVFISAFREAKKRLPGGITIVNATPGSALDAFPIVRPEEVLSGAAATAGSVTR